MKTILSLIFAFSIVAVFAAVSHHSDNVKGEPVKKENVSKSDFKKHEKVLLNDCTDFIQKRIGGCYGIDPSLVCCLTAGNPNTYSIPSLGITGIIIFTSCGSGCTHCCVMVNGVECCFDIPFDWPC